MASEHSSVDVHGLHASHVFKQPLRYIFDAADHAAFVSSNAYSELLKFIGAVNSALTDRPLSADVPQSKGVHAMLRLLEQLSAWVDEVPPIAQSMRYGNKAFRVWHTRLMSHAEALVGDLLASASTPVPPGASVEVLPYLCDSFGNATRIDYGTGHETEFMILLYVLARLAVLVPSDLPAIGLKVFPAYLAVCRKLQRTYWLEPAGSHGVWSIDDYQFLVFLFGSAQLMNHKHIKPRSIHNADVREGYAKDYMYLSAIAFIDSVKAGAPFAEHSPMLNDIAELPTWGKVNEGLAKMYRAEVLGKLPVVQHLVFGTLFAATWKSSRPPVPSEAVAAARAEAARGTAGEAAAHAVAVQSAAHVPVDEPEMTVAPWITQPLPASGVAPAHVTGVAPWARPGGAPSVSAPASSADAFLAAFGPVPHASPAGRRSSKGGDSPVGLK